MDTKPTIVKIAVQMESEPTEVQFIEFNQNEDLSIIIENLCAEWGIIEANHYILKFKNNEKHLDSIIQNNESYVTEQNRSQIINGTVLILTYSPTKVAHDIIEALKSFADGTMNKLKKKKFNLQNLSNISINKTFSVTFINEGGLILLIDSIEKNKYQGPILINALDSFIKIMKHDILPWDILEIPFVIIIANFASNPKIQEVKIIQYSLSILEKIVLNCNDKYEVIEKAVGFPKRLIQRLENENFLQNALSLINALFLKANLSEQKNIVDALFSEGNHYLFQNIIQNREVKQEIAHQIYVTQTLYLNVLADRMNTKIDPQDQNAINKLKELQKIEIELDPISGGDPNKRHFGPFVIDCKLGFTDEENPALDFTNTPPGMLAFDCIVYFAENHKEEFAKIILENSCRIDKRECPVGRSSVELVRVLCKLFKIGVPPSEHKTEYFQLFFSHNYPFYELYRVCISYTSKIWREMRATAEDFNKVINFVIVQINSVLNSKPGPADFEKLAYKLSTKSYTEHYNQWRLENITDKENQASYLQTIEKLKEIVKPELIQLIKRQRLNFMIEGSRLIKIEQNEQEKYCFLKLSNNHKFLLYGDCDGERIPAKEELKKMIRVSDIKSFNTDKDHPQITRDRKSQLLFSLTIESTNKLVTFNAPNEKSYNYWSDGINTLLGNKMTSEHAKHDFDVLLTMEIKLRTLEDE